MDNETVVYRRGPNIVTSREVNQYRYEGYMHLDSTYKYGGRYIDVGGWIKYTQGDREEKNMQEGLVQIFMKLIYPFTIP